MFATIQKNIWARERGYKKGYSYFCSNNALCCKEIMKTSRPEFSRGDNYGYRLCYKPAFHKGTYKNIKTI